MKTLPCRGFALLELLVVAALIAVLATVLMRGMEGGGQAAALQSAQATLANLITSARAKASASGRKTRILIHDDPAQADRYLRQVALQLAREAGASPSNWDTLRAVTLPAGIYVVPDRLAGVVADPSGWKRASNPAEYLVSDLLANQGLVCALEGDASPQHWTGFAITPQATLAALGGGLPPRGALVLALGQSRQPGTYNAGEPPVQLTDPAGVRGLVLSAYGVPALLNGQRAF